MAPLFARTYSNCQNIPFSKIKEIVLSIYERICLNRRQILLVYAIVVHQTNFSRSITRSAWAASARLWVTSTIVLPCWLLKSSNWLKAA